MTVKGGEQFTIQSGRRLRKGQTIGLGGAPPNDYAVYYEDYTPAKGKIISKNFASRGSYTNKYWVEVLPQHKNPKHLIPLKGISVKGRTVTFVGNPGTIKRYKRKLVSLAKRLVNPTEGKSSSMNTYDLYWSPEGKRIATVQAKTTSAAKRKAPYPYRKYLGEIYAEQVG